MADRVAEIEVYAGLEDRDLIAGLRRAEAEVERTAAKIRGEKAEAKVGLDLSEFKRKIKEAQADLKKFQNRQSDATLSAGQRRYAREKAAALSKELAALGKAHTAEEARLKTLKASNAEILRQATLAVAQAKQAEDHAKKVAAAEKRRSAEAQKAAKERQKELDDLAKAQGAVEAAHEKALKEYARREAVIVAARKKALNDEAKAKREVAAAHERGLREEARLEAAGERAAIARAKAAEKARYAAIVGAADERAQIAKLQREYARLTAQAEKINKRSAYLPGTQRTVALDREGVYADMELVRAKLELMGRTPPIGIEVEVERRKSLPRFKRGVLQFVDIFKMVAEKAANLGDIAIRLGPFTGTIKQFAIALAFLGPVIVSVLGAAGALVGVIGTGIVGAATVGAAGLLGLGLAIGGIKMSLKSAAADYKLAQQATDAYAKAVAKHGKGSKEAGHAQGQMNRVLKSVAPLARESALGMQKFRDEWTKATQPTQESFGRIAKGYFGALNAIRPMWAKSTNDLSSILDKNLRGGFRFFKSSEFKNNFKQITDNFNKSVPGFLHALGSIGRGFLNLAREGSKFLGPLGKSFDNLGEKFLKFTQRGDFDDTVKRWAKQAADLGRFLGALGRVMMHFFGAGADAGDGFVISMTNALNRWDRFLTSFEGRNQIEAGFERAVEGTKALWNALAPIVGVFVTWSSEISPFITGLLQGVGAVTQIFSVMSKLLGLGTPLTALGATIGALWAVGKLGAFVSMLARVPAILASIRTQQGALAAVGAVANGQVLSQARAGTAAAAAGRGGAPVATAAAAGATAAAATNLSKVGKAGNLAKGALAGLGAVALGIPSVMAGVAVAAVAAGAGTYLYMNRTREWEKSAKDADKAAANLRERLTALDPSSTALAQSTLSLTGAQNSLKSVTKRASDEQKELNRLQREGKKDTAAYRDLNEQHKDTLLQVRQEELNLTSAEKARAAQSRADSQNRRQALKEARANLRERGEALKELGDNKTGAVFGVGGTKISDGFRIVAREAGKAGKSVSEFLATAKGREKAGFIQNADVEQIKQYAAKIEQLGAAQRALTATEDRATLSSLNHQRTLRGLVPIAASAATAFGSVSRKLGSGVAKTLSVKFKDSGDAARVASSASKALKGGVPTRIVTKIVTESGSAEAAVARLRGKMAALAATRASLKIGASDKASATIGRIVERVNGIKDKTARIQARDEAASIIARIIGRIRGIPDKEARLIARDLVSGQVAAAQAAINRMQGKTVNVVVATTYTSKGKQQRPTASGKRAGAGGYDALIGEGGADEWHVNRRSGRVYKTDGPMFARLERDDAIIPTEPKYKQRGRSIFRAVAKDLGLPTFAAGKYGAFKGSEFNPSAVVKPTPAFKPSKKRAAKLKSARPWQEYIEQLETRQGHWEREVSIRESKIREPEDMVVRAPEKDTKVVVDPKTGETVNVEAFKPNPEIAGYKASLNQVLQAMQTLMQIVQELVRAIPMALQANIQETTARELVSKGLTDDIRDERRRGRGKKGEAKARSDARIDKLKERRDKNDEQIGKLKEDQKVLPEKRIEAGFDYRELKIAKESRQRDFDTADGKAAASAKAQNEDAGKGGADAAKGGGSGSSGATPDLDSTSMNITAQTAASLTQSAEVLRAFGTNFIGPSSAGAQFAAQGRASAYAGVVMTPSRSAGSVATFSSQAAGAAVTRPASESGTMAPPPAPSEAAGATVTINNTFANVPPDPHTWSKGVEFELGGVL